MYIAQTHTHTHVYNDVTQDGLQCHTRGKKKPPTSGVQVHRPDHLKTRVNIREILSRSRAPYLTAISPARGNLWREILYRLQRVLAMCKTMRRYIKPRRLRTVGHRAARDDAENFLDNALEFGLES